MKAQLKYCPDLRDCVLEDRLVPVISNLGPGAIVLTAGGRILEGLARSIGAQVNAEAGRNGAAVTIVVPTAG